ncbi:MAG TPA: hypothetical protein VKT75_13070 [Acidobacteriaceae bacterium]|nr:hypothetical protein [Acidobacteriaceae bacterium]
MGASPESGGVMHARRWIAVGCVLPLVFAGCGGASKVTDPPATTPTLLSGNWAFEPAPALGTTPVVLPPFISGSLSVNGTQVSADLLTLLLVKSSCPITSPPDVTLTGSVANGQISLTSASWNGVVITLSGNVGPDGQSISANWSAKGGCVDGQSGSFVGNYIAPVAGAWTGTASSLPSQLSGTSATSPLNGASVTFQLQQSPTPAGYAFPLSGTVTVAGTSCGFTHGTLIQEPAVVLPEPSYITGSTWTIIAQMDDNKSVLIAAAVPAPSSTAQWLMVFNVLGGACDGAPAQVTLTKQ